jgi:hypothetical protein
MCICWILYMWLHKLNDINIKNCLTQMKTTHLWLDHWVNNMQATIQNVYFKEKLRSIYRVTGVACYHIGSSWWELQNFNAWNNKNIKVENSWWTWVIHYFPSITEVGNFVCSKYNDVGNIWYNMLRTWCNVNYLV